MNHAKAGVYISRYAPYNSDIRSPPTTASFERPMLLWSGLGAAGAGVVLLLLLPKRVAKAAAAVTAMSTGVSATKTIRWGGE